MRNGLYIAGRSAGVDEVIPYFGDLVQGAEADGDRLSVHMEFVNAIVRNRYLASHGAVTGAASVPGIAGDFHRVLYGGSDGVGGFDWAVEVSADLGFQLFRPEGAVRVR